MSQLETLNRAWQCAPMIQLTITLQYILVNLGIYVTQQVLRTGEEKLSKFIVAFVNSNIKVVRQDVVLLQVGFNN